MTLGGQVTRTIAGGIARPQTFARYPALFMFGMLTAETAAMICECRCWCSLLSKATFARMGPQNFAVLLVDCVACGLLSLLYSKL
jgi:hypothetical protein